MTSAPAPDPTAGRARVPEEEAIAAVAEAASLGTARCELGTLRIDQVFGAPFEQTVRVGNALLTLLDAKTTDAGTARRTRHHPALAGGEALLVEISGAGPDRQASCRLSVVAAPPGPAVSTPESPDPELALRVVETIAAFEETSRQEAHEAREGRDPYAFALQRDDLSAEARAILERWSAGRTHALDLPLLSAEGRALLGR